MRCAAGAAVLTVGWQVPRLERFLRYSHPLAPEEAHCMQSFHLYCAAPSHGRLACCN